MVHFASLAQSIAADIINIRRQLHAHAETGFQETWTTAFIREELLKLGIEIISWGSSSGIVGLLHGKEPGPCIALRADIDALPMQENTNLSFSSKSPGAMHACGHDLHTAALLGAAKLLAEHKDTFAGSIKFLFQPAEELLSGAPAMIFGGVLENPKVEFIFGLHNMPELPTGVCRASTGPAMAAGASIAITITGKGGHGAIPDKAADPIVASASLIMALQTIVSREVSPLKTAIISICSIHAGSAGNIIPEQAVLYGTLRAFEPDVFDFLQERVRQVAKSTAEMHRCTAAISYEKKVPCVYNQPALLDWVNKGPLSSVYGADNIGETPPSTGSEDFAYFLEHVPGLYVCFGVGGSHGEHCMPLHNSGYNPDEKSLSLAAATYAQVAWDWLAEPI